MMAATIASDIAPVLVLFFWPAWYQLNPRMFDQPEKVLAKLRALASIVFWEGLPSPNKTGPK